MEKHLWILIASAGRPAGLHDTLTSLAATAKPASYRGALIVENGPRCGAEQIVRSFPHEQSFQHVYVPEANKSHALNCGLQRLDGGLVFMTDDDVRLDTQILNAYDRAARGSEAGPFFGGPVMIDAPHGLPPQWMRKYYPLTICEPWSLAFCQPTVVAGRTFMGTNWAAFTHDLRAIGGFDTRLGPGGTTTAAGQETEAQRRLLARGCHPIYVPDVTVWHRLHKEFLDPQWVLSRAYRHALEWGIRRTRDQRSSVGPMIRGALGRANAHLKATLLRALGGEERRFAAAFHEAKWRGRWQGLCLGRRWDELPQVGKSGCVLPSKIRFSATSPRAA
jgi:GT2 family glycosyltransferase